MEIRFPPIRSSHPITHPFTHQSVISIQLLSSHRLKDSRLACPPVSRKLEDRLIIIPVMRFCSKGKDGTSVERIDSEEECVSSQGTDDVDEFREAAYALKMTARGPGDCKLRLVTGYLDFGILGGSGGGILKFNNYSQRN